MGHFLAEIVLFPYPSFSILHYLAFSLALDGFDPRLSTQLIAHFIQEFSSGPMFHPLSYTDAKKIFINVKRLQIAPTLPKAFTYPSVPAKQCILPSNIFKMSAISHNFILLSVKKILWPFLIYLENVLSTQKISYFLYDFEINKTWFQLF